MQKKPLLNAATGYEPPDAHGRKGHDLELTTAQGYSVMATAWGYPDDNCSGVRGVLISPSRA